LSLIDSHVRPWKTQVSSQSEQASTSTPCKMDVMWTTNIFPLYFSYIANHGGKLCINQLHALTYQKTTKYFALNPEPHIIPTYICHVLSCVILALTFIIVHIVAPLLWPSVGVKPNIWKSWDLESSGTPKCLELDSKGQNISHCGVLGVLERSWNIDIENALALAIRTSIAQVMGKRRAGSQTGSLTPDH
jgi:hypothetical protein